MPDYVRTNPQFSLCGLDCCLCPRYHTRRAPPGVRAAAVREDLSAYLGELKTRHEYLTALLADFNDGRSKGLYCLAAELLPLPALTEIMDRIGDDPGSESEPKKKAAEKAAAALGAKAKELGIVLALRKKENT